MIENLTHAARALPARFNEFFALEVNFIPVKGDPDGAVEGIDTQAVVDALNRLARSPQAQETWDTYDQWRPRFTESGP